MDEPTAQQLARQKLAATDITKKRMSTMCNEERPMSDTFQDLKSEGNAV